MEQLKYAKLGGQQQTEGQQHGPNPQRAHQHSRGAGLAAGHPWRDASSAAPSLPSDAVTPVSPGQVTRLMPGQPTPGCTIPTVAAHIHPTGSGPVVCLRCLETSQDPWYPSQHQRACILLLHHSSSSCLRLGMGVPPPPASGPFPCWITKVHSRDLPPGGPSHRHQSTQLLELRKPRSFLCVF